MQSQILQFYRKHKISSQHLNLIKSHLLSKVYPIGKWIYCMETELFNVYNNVCSHCVLVGCVCDETHIDVQCMKYPKSKVIFKIQLHESNITFELLKIALGKYVVKQVGYGIDVRTGLSSGRDQTLLCENKKKVMEKLNILSKTNELEDYFDIVMKGNLSEPYFLTKIQELDACIFEPSIKKNNWKAQFDMGEARDAIVNYTSTIRKYGFLVTIDSFEITEYYSNKIVGVFPVVRYADIENAFFYKPKIVKSIRVFDKDFAHLIFDYLMGTRTRVYCSNYYMVKTSDVERILNIVGKYFTDYQTVDDIRKHVLK